VFQKVFVLLHHLNLTGTPGLVDPRLERSVHAKDDEPALAGNSLDPVDLFTNIGIILIVNEFLTEQVHSILTLPSRFPVCIPVPLSALL
jgi:hypothetical protein